MKAILSRGVKETSSFKHQDIACICISTWILILYVDTRVIQSWMSWYRQDLEKKGVPHHWSFVLRIYWSLLASLYKVQVMPNIAFDVNPNKPLNKRSAAGNFRRHDARATPLWDGKGLSYRACILCVNDLQLCLLAFKNILRYEFRLHKIEVHKENM